MKTVPLNVKERKETGSAAGRRLRKTGNVPAVLYGHGKAAKTLQVGLKELQGALHTQAGDNVLLALKIEGAKKDQTALIRDIQLDPVSEQIQHVDFHEVSLTEKIHVMVPIHAKGEAAGVKEGGILDHVHREIEVECTATTIPDRMDVNVSALNIGDAIHLKDIVFPKGVKPLEDLEEVVLVCLAPKVEEEKPEGEEEATEPEVITKKKDDEEGEDAPAAKAPKAEKAEKQKEGGK